MDLLELDREIQRRLDAAAAARTRTGRWRALLDADFEYTDILPPRVDPTIIVHTRSDAYCLAAFLASSECTLQKVHFVHGGIDPAEVGLWFADRQMLMQDLRVYQTLYSTARVLTEDPVAASIIALGVRRSRSIYRLQIAGVAYDQPDTAILVHVCGTKPVLELSQPMLCTDLPRGIRMIDFHESVAGRMPTMFVYPDVWFYRDPSHRRCNERLLRRVLPNSNVIPASCWFRKRMIAL